MYLRKMIFSKTTFSKIIFGDLTSGETPGNPHYILTAAQFTYPKVMEAIVKLVCSKL